MASPAVRAPRRRRSSSIKEVYAYVVSPTNPAEHHLLHSLPIPLHDQPTPLQRPQVKARPRKPAPANVHGPAYLAWIQRPLDSLRIILLLVGLYLIWPRVFPSSTTTPPLPNFLQPALEISYRLVPDPGTAGLDELRYGKGPLDIAFLAFYVLVFSFARQSVTLWVMAPLGRRMGIKGKKLERFMEQGYAVIYFTTSSLFGLYVMSKQKSWWYKTSEYFLEYPHGGPTSSAGGMTALVKTYYLLQFSYWLQQAIVMIAGLEAPRDDYVELILHHVITLWLVGVSYWINMTQIGIAIFVSMDIPDVVLAFSKCVSYCGLPEIYSNCSFVVFIGAWGYLRHYQNIRILHAVVTKFHLVPLEAQFWDPQNGHYLPPWMIYHVFTPIFLLQIVISFWSYLILRILFRMFKGNHASDVREDKEVETDGEGGSEMEGRKRRVREKTR